MTGWALRRTVAPAEAPLDLTSAKKHLRVDGTDDDTLISSYIDAAVGRIEEHLTRQLVTATFRLTLDRWPYGDEILLPRPPLQSVTSIEYTRSDGTTGVMPAGDYDPDVDSEPGRVILGDGKSWPGDQLTRASAVRITYVAGYGDAADVPETVVTAIRLLVGTLYEHRESVVVGTIAAPLPQSIEWILFPYRIWWF